MVGGGDEAAFFDEGGQAMDFFFDVAGGAGEDVFVDAADHEEVFAVLLAVFDGVGAPGADFDGEHAIDAGVEPEGHELFDVAVAVEVDDIDAVAAEQGGDAFVVGDEVAFEMGGGKEGAGVVAHVFPEVGTIEVAAGGEQAGEGGDRTVGQGRDHFLEEGGVVVDGEGNVFQAHPVAEPAEEAAAPEVEGVVAVGVGPDASGFAPVLGEAVGVVGVEAGFVVFFPGFAVGEEVGFVMGDGGHVFFAENADAVGLLDDFMVAAVFDFEEFEGRAEAGVGGGAGGEAIHAEVGIGVEAVVVVVADVAGEALFVPFGDGFGPEAEIAEGGAVAGLVVHGGGEALAFVHGH